MQTAFGTLVERLVQGRWIVVTAYLGVCMLVLWQVGSNPARR